MAGGWQFPAGLVSGALIAVGALTVGQLEPATLPALDGAGFVRWAALNLGHASWLFALVLVFYALNLSRLHNRLEQDPLSMEVVELDQLSDVWINLFIGIGVIWTAVGMRSALQAALGGPLDGAGESADRVLRNLVDGGILLALTTTIVGAVGGYLMRLIKTLLVGARLQAMYDSQQQRQLAELIRTAQRIEQRIDQRTEPEPHYAS